MIGSVDVIIFVSEGGDDEVENFSDNNSSWGNYCCNSSCIEVSIFDT